MRQIEEVTGNIRRLSVAIERACSDAENLMRAMRCIRNRLRYDVAHKKRLWRDKIHPKHLTPAEKVLLHKMKRGMIK